MRENEFEFTNDIRSAVETRGVTGAWSLLFATALLLAGAIYWAQVSEISQTAVGAGKVIPSSQTQVVENLEPGLVREILVSEGDRVEKGQLLVRLDETASGSRLGEFIQKQAALVAEHARLDAQAKLQREIVLGSPDESEFRSLYEDQQAVLDVELKKLEEQLQVRRKQVEQKAQALEEARATLEKQKSARSLAGRELELTRNLFKRRAVPELEFLRIQRLVEDLRGDQNIMSASIIRLQAEWDEARSLSKAEQSAFTAKALERKSKVAGELSVIAESIKAAEDAVERTALRAPVGGVINQLNVVTPGEVVQSGSTVLEIVPADDRLLFETRITPKDVAFVRPGLRATIRLSAYDYTKYGTLNGVVERIGADTITDENQETYYRVIVATDDATDIPAEVKIIPGMIATVDVETGKRTILEYLLKPVLRIKDTALREPT
ncbi:MAG: HlyD family type I secretion periplasmic adaptor subunit [Pseudomonadota bacterium]